MAEKIKSKRNSKILDEHILGKTIKQLSSDYYLSEQAIKRICSDERRRRSKEETINGFFMSSRATDALLYLICEFLPYDPRTRHSSTITDKDWAMIEEEIKNDKYLREAVFNISKKDLEKIPNCGRKTVLEVMNFISRIK